MDEQALSFVEWGRQYRGLRGVKIPNTPDGARRLAKLREDYGQYVSEFKTPRLTTTNLPTGHTVAMLGNTMQVLPRRLSEAYVGNDGRYYADDLNSGAQVLMTNAAGQPAVPPGAKRSGDSPYEDYLDLMGLTGLTAQENGQTYPPALPADIAAQVQSPAPKSGGYLLGAWNWLTGGAQTNGQTNSPALPADIAAQVQPSPSSGRAKSPTLPVDIAAQVSPSVAPTPAAVAPQWQTKEEIKAAYRAGQIDQAAAVQMLRGL